MKKLIYISGAVVVVLFLVVVLFTQNLKTKGLPDYNRNLSLKGLSGNVKVFRDKYGVPSIYAGNQKDLYRATGYVMAQDRIWQMDLLRRVTMGRLSEILGEKLVDIDETFRMLQIPQKSKSIMETLRPEEKEILEAFTAGINQYLEDNKENLPVEFTVLGYRPEKWEAIHSINLIGYMAWDLSSAWGNEVVGQEIINKMGYEMYSHLMPAPGKTKSNIYQYTDKYVPPVKSAMLDAQDAEKLRKTMDYTEENGLDVFKASNNWVVSGKKSKTGKPILANDMHLGLSSPGIWYQIHQNAPGVHVTGVALPGAPFVIAGHNEKIAWGMTNIMIDDADFYEEKVKKDAQGNPVEYEYMGKWHPVKTQELQIRIKGKDQPEIRKLPFTHHGPIISSIKKIKDRAVSMRWLGNSPSNELRGVYLLNVAGNKKEFLNAVENFKSVSQNIVYADVEGNIGMYSSSSIPIRNRKEGTYFYEGWNDSSDWKGFVPFEKQPHEFNPKSGVLASANNKTVDNKYPHYISNWFYPPYRFDRIVDVLMEKETISVEDMQNLQLDQMSKMARLYMPDILLAMEEYWKKPDSPNVADVKALYNRMQKWDYSMDYRLSEPRVFEEFYNALIRSVLLDEMGEEIYKKFVNNRAPTLYTMEQLWLDDINPWYDDVNTKNIKENKFDIIRRILVQIAVAESEGRDSKRWGDVHGLAMKHPLGSVKILDFFLGLNKGPYPVGGSFHTVSPYSYKLDKDFNAVDGASHRHVFDVSNWDNSKVVIPTGQSGIPGSQHYLDQLQDYIKGSFHPAWFSREKVEKNARYSMEFTAR